MAVDYNAALQAYLRKPGAEVSTPDGQAAFNNFWGQIEHLSPAVWAAAQNVLAKPDQAEALARDYNGDINAWLDAFTGWWTANGHTAAHNLNEYGAETSLIDALGYQVNPAAVAAATGGPLGTLAPGNPNAVPLEQALLNTTLTNYINPDLSRDPGRRAEADAIIANINRSIGNATDINNELLTGTFDARGYLTRNPDVAKWAAESVADGSYPDLATAAKAHYDNFGKNEGRATNNVTRLQSENQMADDTADRLRQAAAAAAATRVAALDQRKVEMTAALERMQGDRSGALDAQTAQLRAGLVQLETERKAALEELTAARINAAEGQVTGINQGLQFERDRIAARAAAQGFIGGSTMEDSAMTRATLGARQGAAEVMGQAKVANAGDRRMLGDEIANTRFGITGNDATARRGITDDTARSRFSLSDTDSASRVGVADSLATQNQSAADTATKARLAYFDNDFGRRLQAALVPITLGQQQLGMVGVADQLGQQGLNRSLNTLNWWANGTTPPSSNPAMTTPSTTGTDIAALGAGLVRSGFNVGNTVGWGNLFPTRTTNNNASAQAMLDAGAPAAVASRYGL